MGAQTCIIVHGKDGADEANLLLGLMTQTGLCKATIWDEAHYVSQRPVLTSSQKIIFFGGIAEVKNLESVVKWRFQEGSAQYGWLGNRAVLAVDRKAIEDGLRTGFSKSEPDLGRTMGNDDSESDQDTGKRRVKGIFDGIAHTAKKAAVATVHAVIQVASTPEIIQKAKEAENNEYRKLIETFVASGLSEFLFGDSQ
jgi:hypothetical protein